MVYSLPRWEVMFNMSGNTKRKVCGSEKRKREKTPVDSLFPQKGESMNHSSLHRVTLLLFVCRRFSVVWCSWSRGFNSPSLRSHSEIRSWTTCCFFSRTKSQLINKLGLSKLIYAINVAAINAIKYFNAVNATLFTSGVFPACLQSVS